MFTTAHINWTAKQLAKMADKGTINFDNAVQRGYVWNNDRKSLLIHSMIVGYPIPPFYAAKMEEKTYHMLDGKQRSNAIREFINGQFELIDVPEVETADGEVDINGKRFEDLSDDMQDAISGYSLSIYYFDGISDEEINSLFFRLNNGKPLTAIELTRVKAKSLEKIKEIGSHPIFNDALTVKALNKYTNEDIVIKSWAILNVENPSFETKQIRPLMAEADITDEQAKDLEIAFTRLTDAYKVIKAKPYEVDAEKKAFDRAAKRMFTRTHLITLVPIALDSFKNGISEQQFAEWVVHFFAGTKSATISNVYNENATAGSARPEAIKARLDEAMNDYKRFIDSSISTEETKAQDATQDTIDVSKTEE